MRFSRIAIWIDIPFYLGFAAYTLVRAPHSWRYVPGALIAALGFTLWMVARIQLGQSFMAEAKAVGLVTTGLYSRIRNPIYFFAFIAFTGLFFIWGSGIAYALFLAFYFLFQYPRIRKESAVLEAAFGEEYRQYRAKTWL